MGHKMSSVRLSILGAPYQNGVILEGVLSETFSGQAVLEADGSEE